MLISGLTVPGKARRAVEPAAAEPVPDSGPLLELFRDFVAPYLCPDALYERYADVNRDTRASYPPLNDAHESPLHDATAAALTFADVKLRLDRRAHDAVDALARLCADYEVIVNVQGDEPFVPRSAINVAARLVIDQHFPVGTAAVKLTRWVSSSP